MLTGVLISASRTVATPRAPAMEAGEEPNLREEPHPSVWDLVCVGTGLTEALLAGCVRRCTRLVKKNKTQTMKKKKRI